MKAYDIDLFPFISNRNSTNEWIIPSNVGGIFSISEKITPHITSALKLGSKLYIGSKVRFEGDFIAHSTWIVLTDKNANFIVQGIYSVDLDMIVSEVDGYDIRIDNKEEDYLEISLVKVNLTLDERVNRCAKLIYETYSGAEVHHISALTQDNQDLKLINDFHKICIYFIHKDRSYCISDSIHSDLIKIENEFFVDLLPIKIPLKLSFFEANNLRMAAGFIGKIKSLHISYTCDICFNVVPCYRFDMYHVDYTKKRYVYVNMLNREVNFKE